MKAHQISSIQFPKLASSSLSSSSSVKRTQVTYDDSSSMYVMWSLFTRVLEKSTSTYFDVLILHAMSLFVLPWFPICTKGIGLVQAWHCEWWVWTYVWKMVSMFNRVPENTQLFILFEIVISHLIKKMKRKKDDLDGLRHNCKMRPLLHLESVVFVFAGSIPFMR